MEEVTLAHAKEHLEELIARASRTATVPHVRAAGLMQSPHRDPFDRLLAAQAHIEGRTLVSADTKVQAFGVAWLW